MLRSENEKQLLADGGAGLPSKVETVPPSIEPQLATAQTDAVVAQSPSAGPAAERQPLGEEARRKLAEGEQQFALGLMRVIWVLSRSSHYRHYTISDLEWLAIPPLRLGQCAILHAQTPGLPVATAVALWASVSPEVDERLSREVSAPIKLRPDEWRSGDILWLVDVIGAPDAVRQLLTRLQSEAFKDRPVKVRRRGVDGQVEVSFIGA
jgi:cytolysin-activating lysine-acyltransferase